MEKSTYEIIRFNEREMVSYFKKFDYLKFKYGSLLHGIEDKQEYADCVDGLYKIFLSYERTKHHVLYNKINYDDIRHNIKLIYDSPKKADDFVFLYDFALDHLIDRYLNIPSLDKLFSEHYFEYEWRQHIELDFKKSDLSFYRDHFIHQIRNCFMIMKLLEMTGEDTGDPDSGKNVGFYYKKIEVVLRSRHNDISKYACEQVEQYREHVDHTLDSWGKRLIGEFDENKTQSRGEGEERPEAKEIEAKKLMCAMKGNVDDYAWGYLIKGSLIVAALFHDMGYPVNFTYKRTRSISEYISLVSPEDNIGFLRLNDLLEDSLLFRTVKRDELEKRYNALDHGALSAFILLLQFYETGAIRELNPIKRGIIELAAVTMYDHTLKYEVSGEDRADRIKPSFSDNPLSYTLRFVDDLQEWDRTYFEIRSGSVDLTYCKTCKMPINRMSNEFELDGIIKKVQDAKNAEEHKADSKMKAFFGKCEFDYEYVVDGGSGRPCICGCNACGLVSDGVLKRDKGLPDEHIFGDRFREGLRNGAVMHLLPQGVCENGMPFSHQKIIYTETSDEMMAIYPRSNAGESGKNAECTFYVEYDAFRSLCLLSVNRTGLDYRMKELLKVNRQFKHQSAIKFNMRTHMTNNPMMLKMRVLSDFLYEVGHYISEDSVYMKNAAYFDTIVGNRYSSDTMRRKLSEQLDALASYLKNVNFFVYDYTDENGPKLKAGKKRGRLGEEASEQDAEDDDSGKNTRNEKVDAICSGLERYLDFVVPRLMGESDGKRPDTITHESEKDGDAAKQDFFIWNLMNTTKAYLSLIRIAIGRMGNIKKNKETYKDKFKDFKLSVSSNDVYEKAYDEVFDDLLEQLYALRFDDGGMDGYYMEAKDGEESMDYAIKILFDEKYYNPAIIREREVNSAPANGKHNYKFSFFDIYSDMYLFKEMSRFSSDNRKRRMERHAGESASD